MNQNRFKRVQTNYSTWNSGENRTCIEKFRWTEYSGKVVLKPTDDNGTNEDGTEKYGWYKWRWYRENTSNTLQILIQVDLHSSHCLSNGSYWQIHVALSPPENHYYRVVNIHSSSDWSPNPITSASLLMGFWSFFFFFSFFLDFLDSVNIGNISDGHV